MKPRYRLVRANEHAYYFFDVTTAGSLSITHYLMPRWRWAEMCKGIWR